MEGLPQDINNKKKEYFIKIGLRIRKALELHKQSGLWNKKNGKRDWGNVSEHCLVAAARSEIFSDILDFTENLKKDLMIAAGLHDFFKKNEKEIVTKGGLNWDSFAKSSREAENKMEEAGFSDTVIRLANAVGHNSLIETEKLLLEEQLTPEDLACLVLHYIDDYTVGSEWATGGQDKTNLDMRVDNNIKNPRYAQLNEEGKAIFNGETTFEAQRRIGHLVEEKLTEFINKKSNQSINSKDLPQFIDQQIKNNIES